MTAFLTINGKDYTHKDVNLIRDFFTDEQWDCIFDAVSEYKDYPESYYKEIVKFINDSRNWV